MRVDLTLEVPVAAVVGDDQPVVLHRGEDHLRVAAVPRHVEPGLQAEPGPHRWATAVAAPRLMPGRPEVPLAGAIDRESDRVIDRAGVHLIPPHEAGEDRQSRRVGRRPRRRSQVVRVRAVQREDRAAAGRRLAAVPIRAVQLVERARVAIDHQRVPVGPVLDVGVGSERVRTRIALVRVAEVDVHLLVRIVDHVERHPVRGRPEVRVQQRRTRMHRRLPHLALLRDGELRHVHVPDVVGGEDATGASGNRRPRRAAARRRPAGTPRPSASARRSPRQIGSSPSCLASSASRPWEVEPGARSEVLV